MDAKTKQNIWISDENYQNRFNDTRSNTKTRSISTQSDNKQRKSVENFKAIKAENTYNVSMLQCECTKTIFRTSTIIIFSRTKEEREKRTPIFAATSQ